MVFSEGLEASISDFFSIFFGISAIILGLLELSDIFHTMSLFSNVELAPRDPILGLNEAYNSDSRATKVNLGVGVYFTDDGKIPLSQAWFDCIVVVYWNKNDIVIELSDGKIKAKIS
mgnify:CR=1 FL=1